MLDYVLAFVVGLIVGWNVLPQPAWVKALYQLAIDKVKSLFSKNS